MCENLQNYVVEKNDYSIFNEITLHVGVDRKSYYIYVPKFRGLILSICVSTRHHTNFIAYMCVSG